MQSERTSRNESPKLEVMPSPKKEIMTSRGKRYELDAVRESQSELVDEERGRRRVFNQTTSRTQSK